jgi:hypothetical protein
MRQQLHSSAHTAHHGAIRELNVHTTRTLIVFVGCIWLVWHFIVPSRSPEWLLSTWPISALVVLAAGLALFLLNRNFHIALTIWLAGLLAAITLIVYAVDRPELAYVYDRAVRIGDYALQPHHASRRLDTDSHHTHAH